MRSFKSFVKEEKPGLYANIHAKRARIKAGSGEKMRKPGSEGAPTKQNWKDAAKTAKEEVEIDELNQMTLSRYAAKARAQSMDKNNPKRYKRGSGAAQAYDKLNRGDYSEEVEIEEAVSVKKQNYSWGKMVTVHHGSDTSYPLHPEHQAKIKSLKDGEKTSFKDETKRTVTAHREGDKVHLSGDGSSKKTTVAHSHFAEEVEPIDELSKATLASYAKKAVTDARFKQGIGKDYESLGKRKRDPDTKAMFARMGRKVRMKAQDREKGAAKAIDRLAKEEVEIKEESLTAGKRLISKHGEGSHTARVYKDTEYNEYQVHHYKDGKHMGEGPISYHDDKEDAEDTAKMSLRKRMKEDVEFETEATSAYGRINQRFKARTGRTLGAAAKEYGDEAKRLQKEIDAQKAENERRQAAMKKEEVSMHPDVKFQKDMAAKEKAKLDALKAYDARKKYEKMREEVEVHEATPSSQQVKQAIGIARDKRYAKGNVTGAVRAMNKLNPGLAQHPVVKKELQKQNEEKDKDDLPFTPDKPSKSPSAKAGKYGIGYSTAKHLARMALAKQKEKQKESK